MPWERRKLLVSILLQLTRTLNPTVTKRYMNKIRFSTSCRRLVSANFEGGAITSDAGVVLLRELDNKLGVSRELAKALPDDRVAGRVEHKLDAMIRQRVFALCCGYEDLNDHQELRHDPAWQTAVGKAQQLAGDSTLNRWENRADRKSCVAMSKVLVEQFIRSFRVPPKELVLDFDATDDAVHGKQEGRFFHGYYDKYCFLPLYVFCGEQLLVAYLRPSNQDQAKHSAAILRLLTDRFRQEWPEVRILFRADGGFCRDRTMTWCERQNVDYLIGVARNSRLQTLAEPLTEAARVRCEDSNEKQRLFGEFNYSTKTSWSRSRRVLVKAEHSAQGSNPRFVVTTLNGDPQDLYDRIYCARGEAENRIKEQQLDLFADRTSCGKWWANQFRLLLSSFSYLLLERMRNLVLQETSMARARCCTIRLRLLKIGAVVVRNTRQVVLNLPSAYPWKELFALVSRRLALL